VFPSRFTSGRTDPHTTRSDTNDSTPLTWIDGDVDGFFAVRAPRVVVLIIAGLVDNVCLYACKVRAVLYVSTRDRLSRNVSIVALAGSLRKTTSLICIVLSWAAPAGGQGVRAAAPLCPGLCHSSCHPNSKFQILKVPSWPFDFKFPL